MLFHPSFPCTPFIANHINSLSFLYADPGSGMLIWQLLTAAALGSLFYVRTIARKVRNLAKPRRSVDPADDKHS